MFTDAVNTEIGAGEYLKPKEKIDKKRLTEVLSEHPLKTPTKSQIESQLEAME
jgi:hypothetical protein